ncbi:hypothetical protein BDZ94DRAFT_1299845 [Collybia nuda]|uniref:Smr domain-containing protein n=1 Tax=Collybia nuda TaxID=64659 RepID=A0A9P5Y1G0_9AGAR|nr:hypothetical protein BDZ94DRAFT_1299845 [Collybia nuda]
MNSHSTLFESFQREFCPPLDSSLLAALLADLEFDGQGNAINPSARQIDEFRVTLRELSAQADESQLSEFSDLQLTSPDDETSSTPDFYHGNTTTTSSFSSGKSESSQQSFSSPLGFLQAALPHVSTTKLQSALDNYEGEDADVDMWDVVAGILTEESIREMEERGLDGLDSNDIFGAEEISWDTVQPKKKIREIKGMRRKNNRGKTIPLVDVRQQQHVRPNTPRPTPAPDPWTQVSSLSSHLATILPPHPANLFQSYFHCPTYTSPYQALCACLAAICKDHSEDIPEEYAETLFILLDILLPEYDSLDCEERSRLISDIELSLQATHGHGDDALDLVKLLRDLDSDSASGYLEMGIYHLPPPSSATQPQRTVTLPSGPPPVQPPPQIRPKAKPPPTTNKPSPFQWQSVPERKSSYRGPHPLAPHIPAYARDVNGKKVRGQGNTYGQGGKGDVGELGEYRRKMGESMRKRNELLREATRMWQKGNSKTRGGEVAFYFAERARAFQELAKNEALNAARTMVESKRVLSNNPDSVDLHGTTASEAIVIMKEILQSQGSSQTQGKPLKIITGRGSHSVNQVSVLKPAVKKALVEDGWIVGAWDGGLVVRGRRSG